SGGVLSALMVEIVRDARVVADLGTLAANCAAIGKWRRGEAPLGDRVAGRVPFCTMCAVAVAGWQMQLQSRAVAAGEAPSLARLKPVTARYFLDLVVPEAAGLEASARAGAALLYKLDAGELA